MTGSEMNKLTIATMQVEALREQLADAQATVDLEAVFNFVGVKYDAESKTWVGGQAPYLSAGTTKQEACIAAVDALRLACVTWETKYRDLHAELERVRGELAETKEVEAALSSKVAEYEVELNGDPQNFYGRGRTVGLRTLIAALPKVDVVTGDTVVNIVQQYNFHQWMLRALQHRQGMEG